MPTPILVDTEFRAHRRGALARALPHRKSYLGFTLGLIATVVVAFAALGFWLVRSGILQVEIRL